MTTVEEIVTVQHQTDGLDNLSTQEQREMHSSGKGQQEACDNHHGTCAICLNKIVLEEAALVKGCEHAYWFV
ncbi:hypothetical protein Vadar_013453 [Vaccinium darrowii]|uniref:Uncharacterized protein n=1 Tax=Vaccinium darrowii TaxID=229202 RepID=A0ACB7XYQ8_9ERIC|nr:hypothetical protein Vadar_013453 [Vaccinium darrowii]